MKNFLHILLPVCLSVFLWLSVCLFAHLAIASLLGEGCFLRVDRLPTGMKGMADRQAKFIVAIMKPYEISKTK